MSIPFSQRLFPPSIEKVGTVPVERFPPRSTRGSREYHLRDLKHRLPTRLTRGEASCPSCKLRKMKVIHTGIHFHAHVMYMLRFKKSIC